MVTTQDEDGRQIIVRSREPRPVDGSRYRADVSALDTDGYGCITCAEASAYPTLAAELNAPSSRRDGAQAASPPFGCADRSHPRLRHRARAALAYGAAASGGDGVHA
ncbi:MULTISPECIES: hypothetical protein [Luteimonas]|uniref:Uncharacterized protein n=1 Tax=Luteimonas chenhongjianii TaxID=2006110 RepID=A0A290XBE0_9GAMM|nr:MULTISPECIES: hypothetical protein [Luteimonas]ATD66256.1 hypothetical protein CNR27_01310 [Luteimonas chenhongjianii]RPD83449.1 hypothetical protein EGK76_15015 [Luteimonas sp. 100069]